MFKLIAQDGTEYPLTSPVTTIGREDCDILLPQDDMVSRRHAQVERQGDELVIVDVGSTNGTFVNGVRVHASQILESGDLVQVGNTTLTVSIEGKSKRTRVLSEPPPATLPAQPPVEPSPAQIALSAERQPLPAHSPPAIQAQPTKDRSIAIILELLPGFFAFLGIGWIYVGQTTTGVTVLVVDLLFNIVFTIIGVVTAGISLCLTAPLQLAAIGVSTYLLHQYTKKHPELFGP